jgi:hypothetical protein
MHEACGTYGAQKCIHSGGRGKKKNERKRPLEHLGVHERIRVNGS